MAREFVQPGARLDFSNLPVTTGPMTFALWLNRAAVVSSGSEILVGIGGMAPARGYSLRLNGSLQVQAFQQNGFTQSAATTAVSVVNGVWYHAAAVFASPTSRTAYVNGVASPVDATNVAFGAATSGSVGAAPGGGQPYSGIVAEVGVWDVALSAAQVQQLAAGFSPAVVALRDLVGFYTMLRSGDNQSRVAPFSELNTTGTVNFVGGPDAYLSVV